MKAWGKMANLPGQLGDVFFGSPSDELPDWRRHADPDEIDDIDDEEPLSDDERSHLVGVLGFDPQRLSGNTGAEVKAFTSESDSLGRENKE